MKYNKIRLYSDSALAAGSGNAIITAAQYHYLTKVMRLRAGASLSIFNERDGEYTATLTEQANILTLHAQIRPPQVNSYKLSLAFVPIKNPGAAFIVQKATELGVSDIYPVMSRYAVVDKINLDKLNLVAIEAAEQCGRLSLPRIHPMIQLSQLVAHPPFQGKLFFADESGAGQPLSKCSSIHDDCLLIGAEGGFSAEERQMLNAAAHVLAVDLGANILRAETAVIAALAVYQANLGNWYKNI